jgi:hypothetical protein
MQTHQPGHSKGNLNMNNLNIEVTKVQAPVWMVDYSAPLVNENRTGKRDSSGKFLKLHVKLDTVAATFSSADVELAADFGCDASDIFMGSR